MKGSETSQSALYQCLQRQAEASLHQLLETLPGLTAGVITTTDGFEMAARVSPLMDSTRLAAIACSVSALGVLVGKESAVGACRSVLVEAESGYALMVEIPHPQHPMILSLVAVQEELLGQVLYRARRAAQFLSEVSVEKVSYGVSAGSA